MKESLETRVGALLRARKMKLAAAESCTGGLIAHRITNVAGSSDYFLGGVVAYDNAVKSALLGVPPGLLEQFGAVSRETALAMAAGARQALDAEAAVSASGIAGPGGGTPEKPVGTVWLGLSTPTGEWARCFHFKGDREKNKADSAEAALQFLIDYLDGKPMPDANP